MPLRSPATPLSLTPFENSSSAVANSNQDVTLSGVSFHTSTKTTGKAPVAPAILCATLLHDGHFVLLLRHNKRGLVLPCLASAEGEDFRDSALRALEKQFGPVTGLEGQSRFSAAIKQP